MSGLQLKSISASENEFICEETIVTITSGIDHPIFKFISGSFGPLVAGEPCQIPLWLAITLKKKGQCSIAVPDWMRVESLEQFVANERKELSFEPLPFHYIEIAHLLLHCAREDIPMYDRVAVLLKDLENIRMDRAKLGILDVASTVKGGNKVMSAGLTNISSNEILTLKRFVVESFGMFSRLTVVRQEEDSRQNNRGGRSLRSETEAFASAAAPIAPFNTLVVPPLIEEDNVPEAPPRVLRRFKRDE